MIDRETIENSELYKTLTRAHYREAVRLDLCQQSTTIVNPALIEQYIHLPNHADHASPCILILVEDENLDVWVLAQGADKTAPYTWHNITYRGNYSITWLETETLT